VSEAERTELLELYAGVRVADVRDGMDTLLLHGSGSMSPDIRPLWRTRACGIARTARYVPFTGEVPRLGPDEYWEWVGRYYREVCPYPWQADVIEGDFVVIDQSGVDAGLMGSANTLRNVSRGARGFVTNGGVRDTDEIILQRIPFWSAFVSQGMVQGRLKFADKDTSVSVGGVLVHPGDVVVADGDGVIVVPRAAAFEVGRRARAEHRRDMAGRRELYEETGRPPDETLREG
jgi:regulator of RNase E activity RraA